MYYAMLVRWLTNVAGPSFVSMSLQVCKTTVAITTRQTMLGSVRVILEQMYPRVVWVILRQESDQSLPNQTATDEPGH